MKMDVLNAQNLSKQPDWEIVKSKMLKTRLIKNFKYFNWIVFILFYFFLNSAMKN